MKITFTLLLLCCLGLMSFLARENAPVTVYLIGDSTMSIKETRHYPETGWGMPFKYFFDSTVKVENHAKNGRSTRTFIDGKLWQPVASSMKTGDYLFIQFGHNDEIPTKKSATTEAEFQTNLERFITEARKKNVAPVLITPAARRKFDATGKLEDTHAVYSNLVRSVAKRQKVALLDLDGKSQELLRKLGPEASKLLFVHLQPEEHPNYPKGKVDDTHFNELGAREMAQIVLAEMKAQKVGLADRIVRPQVKQ
ncbi:rhamnogalacturonan acetylesterase [Rufibacter glacialis]|uniref:Rhamnogalacturonan acetylesterase n=1 Tax=Rufibacter glacialis TaxID=1259555 RepID=A0A5M8Q446_9BACT|nr:rhamnogalacturonan acetylesterase [Rufibacter glacialis]KAA6430655.1 rhamnogalacturonan acetylesterase [Rufibacter glacialis]GGK85469.1 rhamnogalacturonan acetylesterase RhgT [Rufibacter glacialis]